MEWYKLSVEELKDKLSANLTEGLSEDEVNNRLEKYGPNELQEEAGKPFIKKILEQLLDPMIIILLIAAAISGFMGSPVDTIVILAIVVVNTIISIVQEGRAEEAIAALKKMSSPTVKVIRQGSTLEIESSKLVPGDLVVLETGDIVPADMRLFESSNLKIDESSLTGESVAVEKDAQKNFDSDVSLGDRENYAYSASIVTYGRGKGIVTDTGLKTEIGKIATSISTMEDEETPLQKRLAKLSKILGILTVVICAVIFLVGLLYGHEILNMFMTSVSLAVAAIPEGLPAIVTIVLSIGMGNMAERNAIVKKLLAVETLGTTTYICSDKTGTLTQNQMTVTKIFVDDKVIDVEGTGYEPKGDFKYNGEEVREEDFPSLRTMLAIGALTNDSQLKKEAEGYKIIGDPTEGALVVLSEKYNMAKEDLNKNHKRIEEIPFDSDRKMMTTFHENYLKDKIVSFTKGAPDIVLSKCNRILINGEIKNLTEDLRKEILDKNSEFARLALRGLAYAYDIHDSLPEDRSSEKIENDMIFVGITGMIDPPREEVKAAIKECKEAGIVPVMITGDFLETAKAIAKDLGILSEGEEAIIGSELNDKSPEEIREIVKKTRVFARVSPENKVQIVTALKENGEIAAMTGDGVNDAPAIKKADIGIAMGITGTDVSKNTAEVILTDDNFATIVNAVEEGRIIYENIKKFVAFLLSCNIGEILVIFLSIIFNLPSPFLPIQLLWLNLVTDAFPALALGVERGDADVMKEPPRDPNEGIIDRDLTITLIIQSLAITAATLGVYIYSLNDLGRHAEGIVYARTMAFSTLILAELLRSYSSRSMTHTLWEIGPFSNKRLVQATAFSFFLMAVVMYVPFLEDLFHLTDLKVIDWIIVVVAAFIPLVIGEIQKVVRFNHLKKAETKGKN
ncbi:cation-translocating P-type ATPase [Peptoniphilus catoniae]|uniref:cation-translocating P-type ATPase n=1 Tax=Peptoniphilus catoniae TaxID=1660341 RepID=UPI0010FF4CEB|nr:cation-translocating P-type ATPase [Peptoniphilus catoniae]